MPTKASQPFVKPEIEIELDQHYSTKVYTSGSNITGTVHITTRQDVPYDVLEVNFLGVAHTRLDFVQQFPTHSTRIFMKLQMPVPPSDLPANNIFLAGHTYKIPFKFVVPHQLTIGACNHQCTSDVVREQHLRLPPSVGGWVGDDQAPEMAQIAYSIIVKAVKRVPGQKRATKLFDAARRLKILPARPEDAPLDIEESDERYLLTKSKSTRKNLFTGKTGRLTVSAVQPGALMMSADGHETSPSTARVMLDFQPYSADVAPPRITAVSGKLNASTFFSAAPTNRLPDLGPRNSPACNPSLNYVTSSNLFSKGIEKMNWHQVSAEPLSRRDSGYSSLGGEDTGPDPEEHRGPSKAGRKRSVVPFRYVAEIVIPFHLPQQCNKRFFVPSFHSCLVSRSYTLQLGISTAAHANMSLYVPIQIGVDTMYEPSKGSGLPPAFDGSPQEDNEDVDAYLQPRIIGVVPDELVGGSELPGYAAAMPASITVA